MSKFDFDLFVIGAGSAGVRAARMAAKAGAKVAITENKYLGGTCVNVGCVPKKLMVYASQFAEAFKDSVGFGWQGAQQAQFDWSHLIDQKDSEIGRLNQVYGELLIDSNVQLFEGRGRLVDGHTIALGPLEVTAERILIATGAQPFVPEFPGSEYVITSDDVFYLEQQPKRIAVVGGGYIALEFASIFNGLGSETHLLYRGDLFLKSFDQSVREHVATEMARKGVDIQFNCEIERINQRLDGLHLQLNNGDELVVDCVLMATGRVPNIEGLNLDEAGVALNASGAIEVNDFYQTSLPSVYAMGDVTGRVQLTPVAIKEAMAFVSTAYHKQPQLVDYSYIPTAVFCQPNIATVGLTEQQARQQFEQVQVFQSSFRPMKYSLTDNQERSLMKMIVDSSTDKVVGIHMVGPDAGEIIQGMAVAMKAGATKAVFDSTVGIHPTAAEEFVTLR